MAVSRRFFLFGAGALTTLPFARTAEAFAARRNLPILIPPEKVTETLYATPDGYLYLGRPDWPEWPTWAEFFSNHVGETVDQDSLDRWSIDEGASLEDYVQASVWEDYVGKHYAPKPYPITSVAGQKALSSLRAITPRTPPCLCEQPIWWPSACSRRA